VVPDYRTPLEHLVVKSHMPVHCKKYQQLLPWIYAFSKKKALSQTLLNLESLEVRKPFSC
jgi:hypothetical protein